MSIHHSQLKKADRLGVTLTEGNGYVLAHWPKRNWRIRGANAGHALSNIEALQKIDETNADVFIHKMDEDGIRLILGVNAQVDDQPHTQWLLHDMFLSPIESLGVLVNWMDGGVELIPIGGPKTPIGEPDNEPDEEEQPEEPDDEPDYDTRTASGVPNHGGQAFKEGVPNDANPYEEGSDAAQKWYAEWEEAYDAKAEAEPEGGSVVKAKYRAKYAELGHPTHCGDWLALLLNNLVGTGPTTNLELFETICEMNGVSLAKYKRTGNGWQGRLRMTGRNLLARKVWEANGVLAVPMICNSEGKFQAPQDWMRAQRFAKYDVPAAPGTPTSVPPVAA